ncbi:MAG: 3-oxoacyl-[acyl-carrier-protein] synthase III C-terminal domain-containing protein [Planctomycetota bacterium]
MRIASVRSAFPEPVYDQDEIATFLCRLWEGQPAVQRRVRSFHEHTGVRRRHLALPIEEYLRLDSFGRSNDAWIARALELGERAIPEALAACGLGVADVDVLFTVSVTGVASPALDARLANRLPFRSDFKRVPIFGLGCVAGVAGLARAADYLRAYPDQVAVLLSVELCSLTFQPGDLSVQHLVSTALFGDGAAAVVMVGEERARAMGLEAPRVRESLSVFYPDTEEVMGWRISEKGFEIVLSEAVPAIARERLAPDVLGFLDRRGLGVGDVATWVCHPGGPKVLEAVEDGLGIPAEALALSWRSLAECGNLSSTSVLLVLEETLRGSRPAPGSLGLMVAMGPAFCSELVLFEW